MLNQPYTLYEKIKKSVLKDIETGKLKPDEKIYSENRLAQIFHTSRMTANRALKELSEEGRIVRVQGVGSFVSRPKPEAALLEIKSIAKEIEGWGGRHSSHIQVIEKKKAGSKIAQRMEINSKDTIFHSIIIHKDRDMPIQYSERFINPLIAPSYLEQDFKKITPGEYLLEIAPLQEVEHIIEAVNGNSRIQKYLEIQSDEPCLSLKRRTWAFDRVACFTVIVSPGTRYKLAGRFSPRYGSLKRN